MLSLADAPAWHLSPEAPSKPGVHPHDWGHESIGLELSLCRITGQGSKRQGLFIIFLKWKPEEATHYYWRFLKPPRKKSGI